MNNVQIMIAGVYEQIFALKTKTAKDIKQLSVAIDMLDFGETDDLPDVLANSRRVNESLIETKKQLHSIQLHMGKMYQYFGGEQ